MDCICRYKPYCDPHDHRGANHGTGAGCIVHGHPIVQMPTNGNPRCVLCDNPTQRTGSCYTCLACGQTTSCG